MKYVYLFLAAVTLIELVGVSTLFVLGFTLYAEQRSM